MLAMFWNWKKMFLGIKVRGVYFVVLILFLGYWIKGRFLSSSIFEGNAKFIKIDLGDEDIISFLWKKLYHFFPLPFAFGGGLSFIGISLRFSFSAEVEVDCWLIVWELAGWIFWRMFKFEDLEGAVEDFVDSKDIISN